MDKWEHANVTDEKRWALLTAAATLTAEHLRQRHTVVGTDPKFEQALDVAAFALVDHLRTPITCGVCGQGLPPHPPHDEALQSLREQLREEPVKTAAVSVSPGRVHWMQRRTGDDRYLEIPEMPEGIITIERTAPGEGDTLCVFFRSV